MALTIAERFKYNLYLWYFSWTKVRLIHYCRPQIYDITKEGVDLFMPLDRRTRNHVNSMYIGAMVVGVDMVTGFTAMLRIRESKRNVILIFKDLKRVFDKQGYLINWNELKKQTLDQTINTLSMASPFSKEEKQMLLEAKDLKYRKKKLEQILKIYNSDNFSNKTLQ